MMWLILGIISLLILVLFWNRRNTVWGGFIFGLICGLLFAIIYLILGNGFEWLIIIKGGIIGALSGLLFEMLGKLSDYYKRKHS